MKKTLLLTFCVFLVLPVAHLFALDDEFTYVAGDVHLERGGSRTDAEIGMQVQQSDQIFTGPDATAVIELMDGAVLKLRADSHLDLSTLGDQTTVHLKTGGLFTRVKEKLFRRFEVRAETALAGIRGTEFFVAYGRTVEETPDVWLCVNDGSVEVSIEGRSGKTVVQAGEGINILAGTRLTDPRFYRWTLELNWNTDPRRGEVMDDTDLDQAYSDLLDQDYD